MCKNMLSRNWYKYHHFNLSSGQRIFLQHRLMQHHTVRDKMKCRATTYSEAISIWKLTTKW